MRTSRKLQALALIGAAALLAGCASTGQGGGSGDADSLTYVSWGSQFQDNQIEAWQVPFTEATGTKFVNDSPVDESKIKLMVESGNITWDVVDVSGYFGMTYCGKYTEELDFSGVDTSVFPEGTVTKCGVPAFLVNTIMVYNTDTFAGDEPTSMKDFFDPKVKGTRVLSPILEGIMEAALLADGVAPDELYPLDIDRALAKLDGIKDQIVFADSYGQVQQLLVDNQADFALLPHTRAITSFEAGAKIAPIWDTALVAWDYLAVPKGSAKLKTANEFIKFVSEDAQQESWAEIAGAIPASSTAKPDYSDSQKEFIAGDDVRRVVVDSKWWNDNLESATTAYNLWLNQ